MATYTTWLAGSKHWEKGNPLSWQHYYSNKYYIICHYEPECSHVVADLHNSTLKPVGGKRLQSADGSSSSYS